MTLHQFFKLAAGECGTTAWSDDRAPFGERQIPERLRRQAQRA
jgi:hypothetical protein